jgi:hypothetical protein
MLALVAGSTAHAAEPALAVASVAADGASEVRAYRLTAPWAPLTPALAIDASSRLQFAANRLYAVSLSAGTVKVIDPDAWAIERSYDLGPSSRPIDIAVAGGIAYLTREGATHLLRLDLATGLTSEPVDFAPLADVDGVPDLGTLILDRERLLVQVRRLNPDLLEFFERPAYIGVVDLATESLVDADPDAAGIQGIALQGTAPLHRMQIGPLPRRLFVSASWNTHNTEGGIEMIDLESLASLGIVAAESDPVSGVCCDMAPFVLVSPSRGYFTFSTDSTLSSHLHAFTLDGGIDPADLYTSLDYEAANLVHDPGTDHLFLPTLETGPGFHVFDAGSGARLSGEIVATQGLVSDLVLMCGCGDEACGPVLECPAVPAGSKVSLAALILLLAAAAILYLPGRHATPGP